MRHIGASKITGARYVVVFMQLPDDEEHCLIIESDTLEIKKHDPLMRILESQEGQQETVFGNILARRRFPDGRAMLDALHQDGQLRRVPTANVIMIPNASQKIPLNEVNKLIKDQKIEGAKEPQFENTDTNTGNIYGVNQKVESEASVKAQIKSLNKQAEMAEQDALNYRKKAEILARSITKEDVGSNDQAQAK